jgi:hypothetical protein
MQRACSRCATSPSGLPFRCCMCMQKKDRRVTSYLMMSDATACTVQLARQVVAHAPSRYVLCWFITRFAAQALWRAAGSRQASRTLRCDELQQGSCRCLPVAAHAAHIDNGRRNNIERTETNKSVSCLCAPAACLPLPHTPAAPLLPPQPGACAA